jgi:hypothetical protein
MFVKMETWWDGKEVNNELHLQLHCICTNDNVKPIKTFVRPPSVRSLETAHSFALSTFRVLPAIRFANAMTTQCCQTWESRVCVCVGNPSVYMIPSSNFSSYFVLSGRCSANGMKTLWPCFWQRHARGSETLETFSFRLLRGKQLQWHSEQTVIFQFRYMSLLSY